MVDRGLQVDPLSLSLRHMKGAVSMITHSDVAAREALMRESLALNPAHPGTLSQLYSSRYVWSGEVADAVQLAERLYAVQPESMYVQVGLVVMNLDMADADAAARIVKAHPSVPAEVELAQYRRDPRRAAEFVHDPFPLAVRFVCAACGSTARRRVIERQVRCGA
jgi:hypothetical protein